MIHTSRRIAAVLLGFGVAVAAVSWQPSHAQAPAGGRVALTGVRLIDGTGAAPVERATIVMANGRIEAAGAGIAVPAGATRIDMAGKTVMPGIFNAHGHLNNDASPNKSSREKLVTQLRLYADYGVTTVMVLGTGADNLPDVVTLRDEQANGPIDRARVFAAGQSLRDLTSEAEARARVDRYADQRADIIKIHITGGPKDMTPAIYGALIDQAHKRGLRVAAHLYYLKDAKGLLEKGVDVIAHSIRDQPVDAATIAEIKRRNVGYIPTLTRDLAQFVYETTPAFFTDPFFLRRGDFYKAQMDLLKTPALQEKTRLDKERQSIKQALEQGNRNLKTLVDAGVLVAMGTDTGTNEGQWQGYFEQVELEMMVKAGMTPMQVLVAATSGGAKVMKLDQQLGAIQAGKAADLLVLNANPLTDIRNTRQIHSVWIAGRQLGNVPALNTASR